MSARRARSCHPQSRSYPALQQHTPLFIASERQNTMALSAKTAQIIRRVETTASAAQGNDVISLSVRHPIFLNEGKPFAHFADVTCPFFYEAGDSPVSCS